MTIRERIRNPDCRNLIFTCGHQSAVKRGIVAPNRTVTHLSQPRILVAEDDRYLAALVRQTLEGHDMVVTLAQNGEEAIHLAYSSCPDVVILDVSMPILDGFDVLRTLKADRFHRDTQVLMLTASHRERDVRCAMANGAADFLSKPFRPDLLVKRVKRLLSSSASQMGRAPNFLVECLNC